MLLGTKYKMNPPVSARLISGHPLADKLFAHYLLNEGSGLTAFDSSGRGHHGTLSGSAAWTIDKYGSAVDLPGTTGYISIPDHADFTPAGTPFSVSAWVNMRKAKSFEIAGKGLYNVDGEWRFGVITTELPYFWAFDESVENCRIGRYSNVALTPYEGQFINLVCTYDGLKESSGITMSLNGVRIDNRTSETNQGSFGAVVPSGHDVLIGRYSATNANGIIGGMTFWRRVLTPSDIVKLYINPFCMFTRSSRLLVTI